MRLKLLSLALALHSVLLAETSSPRPTAVVDGKTYPVYVLDAEVKPLSHTSPTYPSAARNEGRGGNIRVGALVNEKGKVSKAYVEQSDAGKDLQMAAVQAVRDWRFSVIKEDGKAVSYVVFVSVSMSMDAAPSAHPKAASGPALEEVIFDAKYLKQVLRPKTIISPIEHIMEIPPDVTQAIKDAKLGEVTQLFSLPAGATPLKRDKMVAPILPQEQRHRGIAGKASFLLYVGADGQVLGLYCYHASDRVFALASAKAMLFWKFKPAKLGDTTVPVLTAQLMEFEP